MHEFPDDSVAYSTLMLFTNAQIFECSRVAMLTPMGHYRHVLELHIDDKQIRLSDESGTCRQIYCGARGSFSSTSPLISGRRSWSPAFMSIWALTGAVMNKKKTIRISWTAGAPRRIEK